MYFISYTTSDADVAMKVAAYLEANGAPCWIAPRDIQPGESYPAQLVQAIRACEGFILVASPRVNASRHVNNELSQAFGFNKPIYPLMIEKTAFSDDYAYFLSRIQRVNACGDLDAGLAALLQAIGADRARPADPAPAPSPADAPAQAPVRRAQPGPTGVRVATYQELHVLGLSALDIARQLVANDLKLYPGMVVENEGTPEQWAEYLSSYPETFRYLINSHNRIVGNWSFLAISEAIHAEKLARGELQEETFRLEETEYLLFPGDYIGYLLNLSLNEGYNSAQNLRLLLDAFEEQLISFAEAGIFFKEWYVNVFRRDHEAMYRRMGFAYLLDNRSFGKLFRLSCVPFPTRSLFTMNRRLMELYHEHFL